ncbi:decaprenylphospho-beta-D-erythro-pentofuranosid-2-ulose 2-reductase [Corynebacterium mendelii]|uniref:Decaprenylphospho-beta-D-erythro-pentofuranosid-2-ulose 2-reductase n=1 Tax=Corynebacterium mendelii TaxID=2765362 RepID=A0A939E189_9CORY|nr:decaprenylphospho-beta-D-erythro-pentofuranosid-2-ulose 2-reductase [Corynebacterium mendelii]MBN9643677.1 decaprenylphospho-beta-D-erythro-pentofuranosid-2-ulose 2-reductase [Corynebacterium mendelii]
MINAVGKTQRILLLGGTSQIATAIAAEFLAAGPAEVILAAREDSPHIDGAKEEIEKAGGTVEVIAFDATDFDSHRETIDLAFAAGDIDVAVVAFGVLGDNEQLWQDQKKAVAAAQTNYTAGVSVGVLLAEKFRAQGHGSIVAISSVAGVKVRRSNFVYGSTKAGFDGFYLQLGEALRGSGAHVVVVRPGQVRTRMTAGLDEAPLTVDRTEVAAAVKDAVLNHKPVVWCHPAFQLVMAVLQHIPQPILRKLPI